MKELHVTVVFIKLGGLKNMSLGAEGLLNRFVVVPLFLLTVLWHASFLVCRLLCRFFYYLKYLLPALILGTVCACVRVRARVYACVHGWLNVPYLGKASVLYTLTNQLNTALK